MIKKDNSEVGHLAKASSHSLPISTKHSIEISRNLRYKSTSEAKKILEQTISLKKAIPFRRFNKDVGHKKGMMSGRYPIKAANAFLKLILSVEANAQDIGLNVENLKISKILANKASSPATGGLVEYMKKRMELSDEEYATIMAAPPKTWQDYPTYKQSFERLRPFFYLLLKLNLIPESFYIKYCFPYKSIR